MNRNMKLKMAKVIKQTRDDKGNTPQQAWGNRDGKS